MASVSNFVSEDRFSLAVNGFIPRTAIVPFVQERADDMQVLVKAGDTVREGQTIAQGAFGSVQATIPGTVASISVVQFPNGKQGRAAKINLGGSFSYIGKTRRVTDWRTYDADTLLSLLSDRGVVNTFSGCESLCAQIKKLHPHSARVLSVRLFDDDPSRVTERFVSWYCEKEITEGVAIIARAMAAAGVVFVKPALKKGETSETLDGSLFSCPVRIVHSDETAYPAGSMHEIVSAVRKAHKESPFADIGNRDVFIDAETALAAYNAAVLSTPLMENYVHITGDCLNAAAIMKVRIGTTLGDLAMQCGGFKRPVAKIIVNGIAIGTAVSSLDVPVTKAVKSVAFLPAKKAKRQHAEKCIRCGSCRSVCPVGLYPDMLYRAFVHASDRTALEQECIATGILCTTCGLCNAVCPSRLPLSQTIPLFKEHA